MATGTKQQWRKLSQQMREHTTPHELGEAVLALSQGKRAASSKTDYRIWVAVIIGAAFILSIGVSREVTNSRALAAQVESEKEARQAARTAELNLATSIVEYGQSAQRLAQSGEFSDLLKLLEFFGSQESDAGVEGRANGSREILRLIYGDDLDVEIAIRDFEKQRRSRLDGNTEGFVGGGER